MIEFFASIAIIAFGLLIYRSAGWFARLFSDLADRSERDGVIRYGGGLYGNKVWKENSPRRFESRIQGLRFSAAFARLFLKAFGAIWVIAAIARILVSLVR